MLAISVYCKGYGLWLRFRLRNAFCQRIMKTYEWVLTDIHTHSQSHRKDNACLYGHDASLETGENSDSLQSKINLFIFFPYHQDRQSFEDHGYIFINVGRFVKKQLLGTSKCVFFIVLTTIASYFCDSNVTTRGTNSVNVWGWKDEWQAVFLYCVWDISHSALGVWCSCFSFVFRVSARIEYECLCLFVTKPESVLAWTLSCFQDCV